MTYGETYGRAARRLQQLEWVSVEDIKSFLKFCDGMRFTVVMQREAALAKWTSYSRDAPYSRGERFPAGEDYVVLSLGDWPNKLAQLMSALQYRAFNEDKSAHAQARGPGRMQQQQQNGDDERETPAAVPDNVQQGFIKSIQSIRSQLRDHDNLWDRERVEHEFRLTWREVQPEVVGGRAVAAQQWAPVAPAQPLDEVLLALREVRQQLAGVQREAVAARREAAQVAADLRGRTAATGAEVEAAASAEVEADGDGGDEPPRTATFGSQGRAEAGTAARRGSASQSRY